MDAVVACAVWITKQFFTYENKNQTSRCKGFSPCRTMTTWILLASCAGATLLQYCTNVRKGQKFLFALLAQCCTMRCAVLRDIVYI